MNELIAYVAPILALAGLSCGWVTEALSPARGYGLLGDMGLGLLGSFALAAALYGANGFGIGLVAAFLVGVIGAAVLIIGQRMLWQNAHLKTAHA